jgi:hypothetical protein
MGVAAVHVGKRDVEDHEVVVIGLGKLHALRCRPGRRHIEFVVQDELVLEGLAEILVVVHDENPACSAHSWSLRPDGPGAPALAFGGS